MLINKYTINHEEGYVVLYGRYKKKKDFEIVVDLDGLTRLKELNSTWYVVYRPNTDSYYAQATIYLGKINGEYKYDIVQLQRYIMEAEKGEYIDHINHDTLDNRRSNLRVTSNKQNTRHRSGANTNNTSGYRNVSWASDENKWIVQLQVNGKNKRLGKFDDVNEAGKFAEEMRKTHYKNYAGKGHAKSS